MLRYSFFFSPMSRILCLLLFSAFFCGVVSGCSWVGRTAGKTQAKIERKADAVEKGYDEGYQKEKAKSAPQPKN